MYDGFELTGKNAIVTGATRGIGLAVAKSMVEAGATVTICGRKQESVDAVLPEFGDQADQVLAVAAHVGQNDDLERLTRTAADKFGPVNVLVNNAGTNPYFGPIVDSEEWAWEKTMGINLKAPYMLSKIVAKRMMESGGGSIVNISSVAGLQAAPMQGIYSVTKAGLIMLTKVMARECGRKGVRVNCICPGVIKTHLSQALWDDEQKVKAFAAQKALGRIGTTDELAGAVIYFASDASSFTTGAVLQVDGGLVI